MLDAFFPASGILDNFNRADEDPLSDGGNWSSLAPYLAAALKLAGNQALATTDGGSWWSISKFGPNCEVYVKLAVVPPNGESVDLYLRAATPTPTAVPCYFLNVANNAGVAEITLYRENADSSITVLAPTHNSFTMGNGDAFGMSAWGNLITGWYKPAGGIWTVVRQAVDNTYQVSGYVALDTTSNVVRFDDFGGGTVPPFAYPTTYHLNPNPAGGLWSIQM